MAITGFLVHALSEHLESVEKEMNSMPEITTYGIHQDQYIVAVAEMPSELIEPTMERVKALEGVLTIYTTYLTIEDEMDENGNLVTNLSPSKLKKKNRPETY